MQLDMDLMREILKDLSESTEPLDINVFTSNTRSKQVVGYHFIMLRDAGLIKATVLEADNDPYYFARANEMTLAGHEYYNAIASNTVWAKVKKVIGKTIGTATLDTVKQVAIKIGTDMVLSNL